MLKRSFIHLFVLSISVIDWLIDISDIVVEDWKSNCCYCYFKKKFFSSVIFQNAYKTIDQDLIILTLFFVFELFQITFYVLFCLFLRTVTLKFALEVSSFYHIVFANISNSDQFILFITFPEVWKTFHIWF